MWRVFTVDLDDTLMETAKHYDAAIDEFVDYVSNTFDTDRDEVAERHGEIDYALLTQYGYDIERFPESFELTLEEFAPNADDHHFDHVAEIGRDVFKTENEYSEQGFMDGAEEMLDALRVRADHLCLVTAGDPRAQQPKVDGLGLEEWFDDVCIVSHDTGKAPVIAECVEDAGGDPENAYHIGNSASSDIEAAIEAGVNGVHVNGSVDWLADKYETDLNEQASEAGVSVYVYNDPIDVAECIDHLFDGSETGVTRCCA